MIGDSRRQACRCSRSCCLQKSTRVASGSAAASSPGGVCDGEGKSAPACDIDYGERGHLQSTLGTALQPLKKCPRPNVCLPLLGMKDASCAETSSERESSAVISTR